MKTNLKPCKIFLAVFLVISLLPVLIRAMSLSTLQREDFANVELGKTTELRILFWNLESSPQEIRLEPKAPENLIVIVQPSEFVLNQSKFGPPYNGEYVHLPIGDVEIFPVKIFVKPTETSKEGLYEIYVSAKTMSAETGINFAQEKTFNFKINVTSLIESQEEGKSLERALSDFLNAIKDFSGKISLPQINSHYLFFAIAVALILLISLLIYKFA